ncbi:MAG: YncE family protein [Ktedonobacterales bacterium]|nr:YncE family protein [Ktedonobacterales bacterium]
MKHSSRLSFILFALVLGCSGVAALLPSGPVHADGGAPNLAYIAGAGANGNALAIIDINQRRVTHSVALMGTPWGVVLSADNRYAYVTEQSAGQLAIVDTRTYAVTGTVATGAGATGIAIDFADAAHLFVANREAGTVTVVASDQPHVLATILVGQQPTGIAIAGQGTTITGNPQVFVANAGSDTISVIDAVSRTVTSTISVPGGPQYVVIPANASVAYVTTRAGAVFVIALATHQVLGALVQRAGASFGVMDYDAITSQIYVPDAANGALAILAPVTASGGAHFPTEPSQQLSVAGGPSAVAITFDGAFAFVTTHDTGQVLMLDATTSQTLATISVGGTPHTIITGSYPPILDRQSATVVGISVSVGFLVLCCIALIIFSRRMRKGASSDVTSA